MFECTTVEELAQRYTVVPLRHPGGEIGRTKAERLLDDLMSS
ncbi:hypothetical protein P4118_21470 [Pseudomonas aeruginosa]|nr:hypothetical protein [Pseudomonas aeruginosa]